MKLLKAIGAYKGLLWLVIRNYIIANKLLALDRNTRNHITVGKQMILSNKNSYFKTILYKLLELDWNTWNHTNVCKQMITIK